MRLFSEFPSWLNTSAWAPELRISETTGPSLRKR
jgi:hypothetical protein